MGSAASFNWIRFPAGFERGASLAQGGGHGPTGGICGSGGCRKQQGEAGAFPIQVSTRVSVIFGVVILMDSVKHRV